VLTGFLEFVDTVALEGIWLVNNLAPTIPKGCSLGELWAPGLNWSDLWERMPAKNTPSLRINLFTFILQQIWPNFHNFFTVKFRN